MRRAPDPAHHFERSGKMFSPFSVIRARDKYDATGQFRLIRKLYPNPFARFFKRPFGFDTDNRLYAQMLPGDEIWMFSSRPEFWACLAGRAGVALVRDGKIVDSIITAMN
jgi:hypothetical protein